MPTITSYTTTKLDLTVSLRPLRSAATWENGA
jgi:hypothetical protein